MLKPSILRIALFWITKWILLVLTVYSYETTRNFLSELHKIFGHWVLDFNSIIVPFVTTLITVKPIWYSYKEGTQKFHFQVMAGIFVAEFFGLLYFVWFVDFLFAVINLALAVILYFVFFVRYTRSLQ